MKITNSISMKLAFPSHWRGMKHSYNGNKNCVKLFQSCLTKKQKLLESKSIFISFFPFYLSTFRMRNARRKESKWNECKSVVDELLSCFFSNTKKKNRPMNAKEIELFMVNKSSMKFHVETKCFWCILLGRWYLSPSCQETFQTLRSVWMVKKAANPVSMCTTHIMWHSLSVFLFTWQFFQSSVLYTSLYSTVEWGFLLSSN